MYSSPSSPSGDTFCSGSPQSQEASCGTLLLPRQQILTRFSTSVEMLVVFSLLFYIGNTVIVMILTLCDTSLQMFPLGLGNIYSMSVVQL